ncbi:MAG: hypothetical protein HY778_10900 [Betaproteobacteria bacterium]|nr:hypothetical protein [Betaproteobacteria bacterium]
MASARMNSWITLPTAGEVWLEYGVPMLAYLPRGADADAARMAGEIGDACALPVHLGEWHDCRHEPQWREASVIVEASALDEVLRRRAAAAAEIYWDRYRTEHTPLDSDFEDESYAEALNIAMQCCGMGWTQVDASAHRQAFLAALHAAAREAGSPAH